MASVFSDSIQSAVLSLLLSRLPLHPLDYQEQTSLKFTGNSGPSLHLNNILLDIDKLESNYLPSNIPFNIRHASVVDLKIIISTSGIQILIDGINCVVSPKITEFNNDLIDSTNSILLKSLDDPLEGLEGMVESVVGFVDAVSGVNSFLNENNEWYDEVTDTDNDDDNTNTTIENSNESFDKTKRSLNKLLSNDDEMNKDLKKKSNPSKNNDTNSNNNNSVLSYAVDYLIGKVHVSLKNINIKIIADPIIMNIEIGKIDADSLKNERNCTIEDIRVKILKPKTEDQNENKDENKSEVCYEDNRQPDIGAGKNKSQPSSNSGSDSDDDLMASSFMAESREDIDKSILESAIYSGSSKSIYMSATSEFHDGDSVDYANQKVLKTDENLEQEPEINGELLATISKIGLSLKNRQDLRIEIDTIAITLVPVPRLLFEFFSLLIQINKQKTFIKQPAKTEKKELKIISKFKLELFFISKITIALNSNLSAPNLFVNENSLILNFHEFKVEQRNPVLIQGSLKTLQMLHFQKSILSFEESDSLQSDIRFEIQIEENTNVTSFFAEKKLFININYEIFELLLSFYNKLTSIFEKLQQLKSLKLNRSRSNIKHDNHLLRIPANNINLNNNIMKLKTNTKVSNITVKTNIIKGNIILTDNKSNILSFQISPISYISSSRLDIQFIKFEMNTGLARAIISFNKIGYQHYSKNYESVKVFNINTQKDTDYRTRDIIEINDVEIDLDFCIAEKIKEIINGLILKIKKTDKPKKKSVTFDASSIKSTKSSNYFYTSKIIQLNTNIKKVACLVKNVNDEFGDIDCEFNNLKLNIFDVDTKEFSISDFFIKRLKNSIEEYILKKGNKWANAPMIFMKMQKSYHFFLNNWILTYSGKWLEMFEKNETVDKYNVQAQLKSQVNNGDKTKKISVNDIYISLTDIYIKLKPVHLTSEAVLFINKGNSNTSIYNNGTSATHLTCNTISILLIDDSHQSIGSLKKHKKKHHEDWNYITFIKNKGYVQIGSLSTILTKINTNTVESLSNLKTNTLKSLIDVQMNISKINLDLCCDSAHCFLQLLKDLKKPVFFSFDDKYKIETSEIDTFKDIDLEFFDISERKNTNNKSKNGNLQENEIFDEMNISNKQSVEGDLNFVEDFIDNISNYSTVTDTYDQSSSSKKSSASEVLFNNEHFESPYLNNGKNFIPMSININISEGGISLYDGYEWKDTRMQIRNALERVSEKAREVANQFDFQTTTLNEEHEGFSEEAPKVIPVIEETLYKSIVLGVGPTDSTEEVYQQINENIGGFINNGYNQGLRGNTQTINLTNKKKYPLRLKRSFKNKVIINLEDINISFDLTSNNEPHLKNKPIIFTKFEKENDSEVVNRVDISINTFVVIDNVPSSSWNMIIGYMREAGEREIGKNMIRISIDLLRPVSRLAAIEMRIQVNILPLRLYVDQDTLDFLIRFGEFNDQRFILPINDNEEMFLQKLLINTVKLKLDYKPKKVDYAGIRSGHTSEFINFFVLDGSEITLNKVVLYGILGFSKLNNILNGFWSPDVKQNQLAGVLSGLAPIRSIINIGFGINNLIKIPLKEYKKDGRIFRSLQVGTIAFTKATSGELLKLGAKIAAGTQTILENTEEVLGGDGSSTRLIDNSSNTSLRINKERKYSGNRRRSSIGSFGDEEEEDYHRYIFKDSNNIIKYGEESRLINKLNIQNEINENDEDVLIDEDSEDDEIKIKFNKRDKREDICVVSLYSNQPTSFNEGLKIAYGSIEKNLKTAKTALYKAGIKASDAESTSEAIVELAKATPIIFIRPAVATTEAISKSLLGAVNDINPEEGLNAKEKYKKFEIVNEDGRGNGV